MSDLDAWITVIVIGALVLIPGRAWIERRIRSAQVRRIVLIVTACDHPIRKGVQRISEKFNAKRHAGLAYARRRVNL
jgi:hypothetical protein